MPLPLIKNYAESTLAAGINSTALLATLNSSTAAKLPTGAAFIVAIWNVSDFPKIEAAVAEGAGELMLVTRSGTALTIVARAIEGTTAVNLNTVGKTYAVRNVITAGTFDDVATKTGAETLSNKTFEGVTQRGSIAYAPNVMSGTVISTAHALNTKTISADTTFTFSGAPSGENTEFGTQLVNSNPSTQITITIPVSYDPLNLAAVTSFSIAPNAELSLKWRYDGVKYLVWGPNSLVEKRYYKSAHGFALYDAVRRNESGVFVKAQSNSLETAAPHGVVSKVIDSNYFILTPSGSMAVSGLEIGEYYLSDTTAGLLTRTSPANGSSSFQTSVMRVVSATEAFVKIESPRRLDLIPASAVGFIQTDPNAMPVPGMVPDHPTLINIVQSLLDNNGVSDNYSAVTVTGDVVDGALATKGPFVKTISGLWTPTFSNFTGGREYDIELTNTGSGEVEWPADVLWENDEEPLLDSGSVAVMYGFRLRGGKYRGRKKGGPWTVDTVPPTVASATIATVGSAEFLIITLSENGRIGTAGSGGFTTSVGALGPLSNITGAVLTYPFTTRIASSATVTLSYAQPTNGVQDANRNDLASFSGTAVSNGSTYSPTSYVYQYDFNTGSGTPVGITVIGSANFAYTAVALEGERSSAVSSSNTGFYITFTEAETHCAFGMLRLTDLPGAVVTVVGIRGAADQALCSLRIGSGGALTLFANGLDTGPSALVIAANTTYYWWLEYTVNGTAYLRVSTTSTKPGTTDGGGVCYLSRGVGSAGILAGRVRFGKGNTTGTNIWDKLRGSATPIGSNPV